MIAECLKDLSIRVCDHPEKRCKGSEYIWFVIT